MAIDESKYDGLAAQFLADAHRRGAPERAAAYLRGVTAASVSEMQRLRAIGHPDADAEADAIARVVAELRALTGERN